MTAPRILVTGAAGLVGSRIARALVKCGASVMGFDKLARSEAGFGDVDCDWEAGDIRDREALDKAIAGHRTERIVHAASILQADVQKMPSLGVGVNVTGTMAVFDAARESSVDRVVFTSSIAVYGGTRVDPMSESHPCAPVSVYGTAKLLGEQVGSIYAAQGGFDFTALRYGLVYGPGKVGSAGIASRFQDFVRAALEEGVIRLPHANPRKPFLFVDDAVAAAIHACTTERTINGVFNVSGEGHSMDEVGQLLSDLVPGAKVVHEDAPTVPGEVNGYLDVSLAQQVLGFQASIPMRDGLAAICDHVRQQNARLLAPAAALSPEVSRE